MLECLLVVALSGQGDTGTRNWAVLSDVPEARVEMVMAVEAGRRRAAAEARLARTLDAYAYGYDCGDGWRAHGLEEAEVFGSERRRTG